MPTDRGIDDDDGGPDSGTHKRALQNMSQLRRSALLLLLGLYGCMSLPSTLPLDPVRTIGIAHDVRVEKPSLSNEYAQYGLLIALIGYGLAERDEKRLGKTLETTPGTLADFLRDEFTEQISQSGRFTVVAPEDAQAIASLAITEINLGKPLFEDRDRPIVRIEVTIADRDGRRLWHGTTRVHEFDKRTPIYSREAYMKDAEVAYRAFSTAIRMAVVDLVRHFQAGRPQRPVGADQTG